VMRTPLIPLRNAQYSELLAKAKAEGWEIRVHPASGAVQMRHPTRSLDGCSLSRKTRRLIDRLWRESYTIFDPTTAKLA